MDLFSHSLAVITVSLEQENFTVIEGGAPVLPVNAVITNGSLEREVEISFFTVAITATAGMDYSLGGSGISHLHIATGYSHYSTRYLWVLE